MFLLSSSRLTEEWDFLKAGRVTNCGGTCIIVKEEGKDGEKVIPVMAEGLVDTVAGSTGSAVGIEEG